jgi:hypothetical protein
MRGAPACGAGVARALCRSMAEAPQPAHGLLFEPGRDDEEGISWRDRWAAPLGAGLQGPGGRRGAVGGRGRL